MNQFSAFVTLHWPLFLALVIILLLIFLEELSSKKNQPLQWSPQELVKHMNEDNVALLDLRERAAFEKGHILHAISLQPDEIDQKINKYKTKLIVLICETGAQSTKVSHKIKRTYKNLQPHVLKGGIAAWRQADLPIIKGK